MARVWLLIFPMPSLGLRAGVRRPLAKRVTVASRAEVFARAFCDEFDGCHIVNWIEEEDNGRHRDHYIGVFIAWAIDATDPAYPGMWEDE